MLGGNEFRLRPRFSLTRKRLLRAAAARLRSQNLVASLYIGQTHKSTAFDKKAVDFVFGAPCVAMLENFDNETNESGGSQKSG